jgi:cell division protein FtsL
MSDNEEKMLAEEEAIEEQPAEESLRQELKATEQKARDTLKKIAENVHESDSTPVGALTLRKILGGDILSADMVRRQIWLFMLIVLFTIVYVAIRYQCQQDMIQIDKMEKELVDAKYKSLSSSSVLTERSRESHVLEVLRMNHDSLLQASEQPPYIINVPED